MDDWVGEDPCINIAPRPLVAPCTFPPFANHMLLSWTDSVQQPIHPDASPTVTLIAAGATNKAHRVRPRPPAKVGSDGSESAPARVPNAGVWLSSKHTYGASEIMLASTTSMFDPEQSVSWAVSRHDGLDT